MEAALLGVRPEECLHTAERFSLALTTGWVPNSAWFRREPKRVQLAFDAGFRGFFGTVPSVSFSYTLCVLDNLSTTGKEEMLNLYPKISESLNGIVQVGGFTYDTLLQKFGKVAHPDTVLVSHRTEWMVKDRFITQWKAYIHNVNRIKYLYLHKGKRGYILLPVVSHKYRLETVEPITNEALYRMDPRWLGANIRYVQ